MNMIDLNTCVPGQKVRLRNGNVVKYEGPIQDGNTAPYTQIVDEHCYMNNGCYWKDSRESSLDVLEILPLESFMNMIDLNTCVPGQKVRLRDGKITTYNGLIAENTIYTHNVDGYSYTKRGTFWVESNRISPKDIVEILPIEKEPVKLTTQLTHSITDQIDVANPDHVSIIPHTDGITICIKKGLTTISWKHNEN